MTATPTPPAGPAIVAKDSANGSTYWFQDASSADPTDNSVTIPAGGTVNFSYPVGRTVHNVDFRSIPDAAGEWPAADVRPAIRNRLSRHGAAAAGILRPVRLVGRLHVHDGWHLLVRVLGASHR